MIDKARRQEILKGVRPKVLWRGEPPLGAWYTEEEIEAVVKAIRDSMDWNVGFTGREIEEFEE
ncbi:MAG TPA: hypothetical protein EYP10_04845, partial [Armatimonadetes bacterium]|nr:hypothetical protein [Armatimonadota bacterium]